VPSLVFFRPFLSANHPLGSPLTWAIYSANLRLAPLEMTSLSILATDLTLSYYPYVFLVCLISGSLGFWRFSLVWVQACSGPPDPFLTSASCLPGYVFFSFST